ncbi:choice-of-anchor D domain-containing protein [Dactylosporangium sp. NPDC005572]|uniref:choice-of-anchor D domain-containing protein n=1 Tax=Dactylosporangium sp. NPDC005572 TaxID=3156889 RepID=UPI0033A7D12D
MRGAEGFYITAQAADGNSYSVNVGAPTGQQLAVGTFPTTRMGDATHYSLDVSGQGFGCNDSAGSVTIHEITRDPSTNDVTTFAATYHQQTCLELYGEIRWHSGRGYAETTQSPTWAGFGTVGLGHSVTKTVTLTSTGSTPITLQAPKIEGTGAAAFKITGGTCAGATRSYGQTCTVTVQGTPTKIGDDFATLTMADNSDRGKRSFSLSITGRLGAEGTFQPLTPSRILDTREGNGAPKAPLGANQTLHLQVLGRGGVPQGAISAVVLNVTVVSPTSAGYLTVFPTGVARPLASNLNYQAGWIGANAVTVPIGTGGKVDIFNPGGNVHVVADVLGYYYGYDQSQNDYAAGQYWRTVPERILDSRDPGFGGAFGGFEWIRLPVSYGTKYDSHIRALAVNITAVDPSQGGYITTWNGYGDVPTASTLNFTPHSIVPNFAIVPTAMCFYECSGNSNIGYPSIGIANMSSGKTHIIVDIFGFYDDGQVPGGLRFHPLTPTRIVDTRSGLGAKTFTGAGTQTVKAPATVAGDNTVALVSNATGVNPSNSTYLSLWANGTAQPTVSNLNLARNDLRSNAAVIGVGGNNDFNIFNAAWRVDVVIDVSGTFEYIPGSGGSSVQANGLPQAPAPLTGTVVGTPQKRKI